MLQFDTILGSIYDLSDEEKLKLRLLLDKELKSSTTSPGNGTKPRSELIGLFSDEPGLMDRVMQSVYEQRSRPLRTDQ